MARTEDANSEGKAEGLTNNNVYIDVDNQNIQKHDKSEKKNHARSKDS